MSDVRDPVEVPDVAICIAGIRNDFVREALTSLEELSKHVAESASGKESVKRIEDAVRMLGLVSVEIHPHTDGPIMYDCFGNMRWLTLKERFLWWAFKVPPKGTVVGRRKKLKK